MTLEKTLLDPTWTDPRLLEPEYELKRVYGNIFDKKGNELPCIISFWKSHDEIREVKVSVKDTKYSDFIYDVLGIIFTKYGNCNIIGEIERI